VHTSVGISPRRCIAAAFAAVVTACLVCPSAAWAAPPTRSIEAKRQEAAAASRHLEDLGAELEMRAEEYDEIESALQETRARISATRADLERATTALAVAEKSLGERAASIYRTGEVSFLDVLVGVRDFGDLLTWLDYTRQVARSDATTVLAVKDAAAEVESAESALEARETEQAALRGQARIKRAQVERAVKRQRSYVTGLNTEVAKLVAEERAREARIAAERARRAAAAAAAQRETAAASSRRFDPEGLGGGHPEVVGIGLKYVGVPYVWGGSSPTGFDCSGLTQYVFAEAGIEIPRTSRTQFAVGDYIPSNRLDLLRAGDLVFFGFDGDANRIHHVGLYVGDGNFLHAPQTGENVQVSSLAERIASRGDYVGACRF
jgi:cell wall-associated NlpC family hydrolase